MKVLSINEALEKGLLRKSAEGLIISDINNTINLEDEEKLQELQKSISTPSIIVSDDEKNILCTTISKEAEDFNLGYKEKRKYTFPRVYTSDNSPVLVGGISFSGRYPDRTKAIQDNENIDINDYSLHIKSAKGGLDQKAKVNKDTNLVEEVKKLEEPISLSFKDNTLEVNGGKIKLEENDDFIESLPIINRESFLDFEYYIELADGRKSDFTYGYIAKPSLNTFCLDVIEKINKLKIIGNIEPEKIECGEYNGNIESVENYYEFNPKEIEIIKNEDKELEDLIKQDSELDKKIDEAEKILEQYKSNDKNTGESTKEI